MSTRHQGSSASANRGLRAVPRMMNRLAAGRLPRGVKHDAGGRLPQIMKHLAAGLLGLALLVEAGPAAAVVIELANGQRLEGTLRQASSARVQVEVGDQIMTLEASQIRAIYFSGPEAAA